MFWCILHHRQGYITNDKERFLKRLGIHVISLPLFCANSLKL